MDERIVKPAPSSQSSQSAQSADLSRSTQSAHLPRTAQSVQSAASPAASGQPAGSMPAPGSAGEILSPEELRMLAEIGFLGCGAGHSRAARLLFEGLRNLRPRQPFAYIGLAMSRIEAGDPGEAIRILEEEGLRNNPDNEELKVFLGLALSAARRSSESQRMLAGVADRNATSETAEIRLARRLLGQPASERHGPGMTASQGERNGT